MPRVPMSRPVKNILCVRTDRLGEFLLTLPAIKAIKDSYPQARVSLACLRQNADLIKGVPFVDDYIEIEAGRGVSVKEALRIACWQPFDIVVVFNPLKSFHIASALARIPLRVGYNRKWGFFLNRKKEDAKYLNLYHEIEYNLQLVSSICGDAIVPDIPAPWENKEEADAVLVRHGIPRAKPLLFVHPFSSDPSKEIEFEFWQSLLSSLRQKGWGLVLIGLEDEFRQSRFSEMVAPGCWSLCGKISLRELAAILRFGCGFYIGVDSGPFHIASLLRKPLAVLFRKEESVKRWGPFGNTNATVRL